MSEKELNNEAPKKVDTKKPEAKKDDSKKEKKPSIFARIGAAFKSYVGEIKKITWPTYKQTANNTVIVITTMIVMAVFVMALDTVFQYLIELLSKIG